MTLRVIIQPEAAAEIERTYLRIAAEAPRTAAEWYNRLFQAIQSLSSRASHCSLAPEDRFFEHEIRHLLFGRKSRKYRVLFTCVDDRVHVLHFRHWAQRNLIESEVRTPSV